MCSLSMAVRQMRQVSLLSTVCMQASGCQMQGSSIMLIQTNVPMGVLFKHQQHFLLSPAFPFLPLDSGHKLSNSVCILQSPQAARHNWLWNNLSQADTSPSHRSLQCQLLLAANQAPSMQGVLMEYAAGIWFYYCPLKADGLHAGYYLLDLPSALCAELQLL